MKKILLFLIIAVSVSSFSQIQYNYYPVPSGTTFNLNNLWMISNEYFITGNNGILLSSTNVESGWTSLSTGTTANLYSFLNEYLPFYMILGSNGKILKKSGGIWSPYQTNINDNLVSGGFFSTNLVIVGSGGKVYKKRISQSDSVYVTIQTPTTNNLNSIWGSEINYWAAGNGGVILKSLDTGNTWIPQVSGTTNKLNFIMFKNNFLGFAVGDNGTILKTTNGGTNWILKNSTTNSNLNNIDLSNRLTTNITPNISIAGNKVFLYSNDTGNTWSQYPNVPQYNFTACWRNSTDYWGHTKDLLIGEGGKIYKRMIDTFYHTNTQVSLSANSIKSLFNYNGIFDQDVGTQNKAGFEWPKGTEKTAVFTAGLCIAAYMNGQLREAMASYTGEYRPGSCSNGNYYYNDYFKIYKVNRNDNPQQNWDWMNWGQMVPYGAPYIDVNNNNVYEPLIDTPGVKYAYETMFLCMTDANPESHTLGEGFGGGTLPLGAEVHMTAWTPINYNLDNVQFISFDIINKSGSVWNKVKMGIVSDPDVGDSNDDYIGCDTNYQLAYCFNADNDDIIYGIAPPAVGFQLLHGPLNRSVTPNIRLRMLTFGFFQDPSVSPPPCESSPNGDPYAAYLMMSGYKKDSTCWLDPTQNPYKKTKFVYPGNPETNSGWSEQKGSIQNCNRDSTGTYISVNPPGDRRLYFTAGGDNFDIQPGESQKFVIAQLIARGSSNKNSVTLLKSLSQTVWNYYAQNFPIGINQISNSLPESYSLFQNYPNPFNPVTTIKYQIPKNNMVTLKVYDALGREVETLVNEIQHAGTYEVLFPGSTNLNLASGIYFYKLEAGNFNFVKKMVLLK
jgi:hypothetical protein